MKKVVFIALTVLTIVIALPLLSVAGGGQVQNGRPDGGMPYMPQGEDPRTDGNHGYLGGGDEGEIPGNHYEENPNYQG